MKKLMYYAVVAAAFILSSCGGNKNESEQLEDSDEFIAQLEEEPESDFGVIDDAVAVATDDSDCVTVTPSKESNFELENVILPSQLKGKVEVISASKEVGRHNYPKMDITFKLLQTVNTSSMVSPAGQMWIYGIGQDENGVDVKAILPSFKEWRSGDYRGEEFKEFLESKPGATISLEFTGSNGEDGFSSIEKKDINVKDELEKVKKFKLKLTN